MENYKLSIPKIIHYCWFGENPKSELIEKCIASWKKYAPDFKIIEWNENNYDIDRYIYTKQAYREKKYAFVSDVARFQVLFEYGGIYLDTDVELLKPIDQLLNTDIFMAYDQRSKIASGLVFGSTARNKILEQILDYYRNNNFLLSNGRPNTTTVVTIVSNVLENLGIKLDGDYFDIDGITMYPWEYFDPLNYETKEMRISSNTYAVHYYAMSWKSSKDLIIYRVGLAIKRVIGPRLYEKIALIKHRYLG